MFVRLAKMIIFSFVSFQNKSHLTEFCICIVQNKLYWLPTQMARYHWFFENTGESLAAVAKKERRSGGHMIKCSLTEFGRAGRENIWLSVMTYGPSAALPLSQ